MPRPKEAERDAIAGDTRQRLLEAALEEIAREGYMGAKVDRISQAAGFAKGTIYNYFPSKRDLMLALLDTLAELHLGFTAQSIQPEQDARQRLESFFRAGLAFTQQHLAAARVLVNTVYGPDEAFKLHLYAAYQPMFQLVGEIVAVGVAEGRFRQLEPSSTAALLMTFYLGMASQVDESGRTWLPPDQIIDFVLHAVLK